MKLPNLVGTLATLTATILVATAATGATVTKAPDVGPYWQPLSTSGTYVYADSFVAPVSGPVTSIGLWLTNDFEGDTSAQPVVFEILGSAGSGPDASNILATTGILTLDVTDGLDLFSASTTSSVSLVAGDTYWVAGDERGLSGGGGLQVGAHTQNSDGIVDNGTFWFSNDPTGATFDGQNRTPEMAFTVSLGSAVPEPATWTMMLVGFGALGAVTRRRRNQVTA